MNDDHGSEETVLYSLRTEADQAGAAGLSKLEIERTRVFFAATVGSNQYGSISNLNWTIKYRADGSGTIQASFSESIKSHLINGKTTVSVTDAGRNALATWDVSFWRLCGSRTISFEQPITAAIGELAEGISLEVDGTVRRC